MGVARQIAEHGLRPCEWLFSVNDEPTDPVLLVYGHASRRLAVCTFSNRWADNLFLVPCRLGECSVVILAQRWPFHTLNFEKECS